MSGCHLFQTQDAGKKWVELTNKLPPAGYGRSTALVFTDLEHGCFMTATADGKTGTTEDGGKTWKVQKTKDKSNADGVRLVFATKERGWYSEPHGTVHATVDGGKTWTALQLGDFNGYLRDLHFADAKLGHVLVDGAISEVRRTADGGKNWVSLGQFKKVGYLYGLSFPSHQHGWVVGDKGYIAHYYSK